MNQTIQDAQTIFQAALSDVDPEGLIHQKLSLEGSVLTVQADGEPLTFDLDQYHRILVVGVGKASARMALGVEQVLGTRITDGLVAVKYGHTEPTSRVRLIEAGHPVPDARSVEAARSIVALCRDADEKTLVINLISGGGSALMCCPYSDSGLSLEDKQQVTQALLACGAEIQEINCIRKHLSGVKGGRLAQALYPADSLNLILSDVVGDHLDAIASGLTAPDPSSFSQAVAIVDKYTIHDALPPKVLDFLTKGSKGEIPETPGASDPAFAKTQNMLIGSNFQALKAARSKARDLGYNTIILSSQMTGEAREAAKFYLGIASEQHRNRTLAPSPACIIAGGETTVTMKGDGTGGRNQEMALAFLNELKNRPELHDHVVFLSGATDGNDGPTDAAGGIASAHGLEAAREAGVNLQRYLDTNDSYNALEQSRALLKTGPTNTNVCDVQVLIVT